MPARTRSLTATAGTLLLLAPWAVADEGPTRTEIARQAKQATVLIEVKGAGFGSGFCVHPSGLFVTDDRVVRPVPPTGTATVVLDAGLKTQQTLKATVIRRDEVFALLRVEGAHKLPALSLGSDETLADQAEVITSGYPLPTPPAAPGEYPAISIGVCKVKALRRDDKKELTHIQLDTVQNKGSTGGPVLDRNGKVVGVVYIGVFGSENNTALPVSRLARFLARPEFTLTPPTVTAKNKHEPAEFRATAVPLFDTTTPLELDLFLANPGIDLRRFPMKAAGGAYSVQAVPFPPPKEFPSLRLDVKYKDGSVSGLTEDRVFSVGKQTVPLSDVRRLRPGPSAEVILKSSRKLEGPLTDLDTFNVKLGEQSLGVKLASAVEVTVTPLPGWDSVTCVVVAQQGGKEVGRHTTVVPLALPERPALANLREGKFVKPAQAADPSYYFTMVSSQGDPLGEGKTYSFEGGQLGFHADNRTVMVRVNTVTWFLDFTAPAKQLLNVGEYRNAKMIGGGDASPGFKIVGNGRQNLKATGEFVIWELERKGNSIAKLAVDFIYRTEDTAPPLYGTLRYNSSFE